MNKRLEATRTGFSYCTHADSLARQRMMLRDVLFPFGAPQTADLLDNNMKGNYGCFCFAE